MGDPDSNLAAGLGQLQHDALGVLQGGGVDPAACGIAVDELATAPATARLLPALVLLLAAARCGPRGRLLLRLRGAVPRLLALAFPPPASASLPLGCRLAALAVLRELCLDEDAAYDLGAAGGHVRLLRAVEGDAELVDAAAEVMARCAACPGSGFPMMRGCGGDARAAPRAYSFASDAGPQQRSAHVLLLREVPQLQEAQATVGFLLWGAATVLCNWLVRQPRDCWRGLRVLEIGAGLGLCGLLAAERLAPSEMVLTDYQRDVVRNMQHNAALNFGRLGSSALTVPEVRTFDWDDIDAHPWCSDRFDVIIGSDVICEESNCRGVVRSLRRLLKPGGTAYLVNPTAHSRWTIESFQQQLREAAPEAGDTATAALVPLITSIAAVRPEDGELLDGVFDRRDVSYEFYTVRAAGG